MSIAMKPTEEISRMNVALRHCSKLKVQLNNALAHVQHLDAKYNQTDYAAILRDIENNIRSVKSDKTSAVRSKSRNRAASPYRKQRPLRENKPKSKSSETLSTTAAAITIKPSTPTRMVATPIDSTRVVGTSIAGTPTAGTPIAGTPKRRPAGLMKPRPLYISASNASSNQSLSDAHIFNTPVRSIRELRADSNKAKVDAIKVQRDLEGMVMKLQFVQKEQRRVQRILAEQSLYRSSSNSLLHKLESSYLDSPAKTPASAKRTRLNESEFVLRKVQVMYGTPLQKMHKRLKNLNAALVKTC